MALGKYEEAEEFFRKAIEDDNTNIRLTNGLKECQEVHIIYK